jgi:hypothetical protein
VAYRFNGGLSGNNPQVRCSIGAGLNYQFRRSAQTFAALLKRTGFGTWDGIFTIDNGSTGVYIDALEFNFTSQLSYWNGSSGAGELVWQSPSVFDNTSDWMIVTYAFDAVTPGGSGAPHWVFKVGANAWDSDSAVGDSSTDATAAGSGYRFMFGNDPTLADDAVMDLCCAGMYKGYLDSTQLQTLSMTDFSTWFNLFSGPDAGLWGFETIDSIVDRTGNGANEVSRNQVTLVADPPGWSWDTGPTQLLRPDADLATTGWSTAPLHSKISDESDATVITGNLT